MSMVVPILRLYCGEYECLGIVTGEAVDLLPDCQTRVVRYRRCWRYPLQMLQTEIDFVLEQFDVRISGGTYRMYAYIPDDESAFRYYPIISFLIFQQGVMVT